MTHSELYGKIEDAGLFRLLQQDDREAFTELYHRYSAVLYLFIIFYIKDEEVSRDCLQDIFLSLWENRHRIKIMKSVRNYLYTSAKNKVLNQIRTKTVIRKYLSRTLDEKHDDVIQSPEEICIRQEMNRLIELAISDLGSEKKQQILSLRQDGLSNKEIAQRLDIPETTVRMYYSQSVRSLRDHFKKMFTLKK